MLRNRLIVDFLAVAFPQFSLGLTGSIFTVCFETVSEFPTAVAANF